MYLFILPYKENNKSHVIYSHLFILYIKQKSNLHL